MLTHWLENLTQLRHRKGSRRRETKARSPLAAHVTVLEPRTLMVATSIGEETRVNQQTTFEQSVASNHSRSVASDAFGNHVITWASFGQDGDDFGIMARLFDVSGNPLTDEFVVNSYTTGLQTHSSVAMDQDGDFVIAWYSSGQDGDNLGVYAQRYDASGSRAGSEFRVNTFTTGAQAEPSVAMDADGNFVIVWQSYGQDGSSAGLYGQRYSSNGTQVGSEFAINDVTQGAQRLASIAMEPDGDFVVAWETGALFDIRAKQFDATASPKGNEFVVASSTVAGNRYPSVSTNANGDFVITWHTESGDASGYGVYARRYESSGTPLDTAFRVNSYTTGNQWFSSVAMDDQGDFAVTWESDGQDSSGEGVYARQFSSTGQALATEFPVHSFTTGNQSLPTVSMNKAGDFVVAWASENQDGNSFGVFSQLYAVHTPYALGLSASGIVENLPSGTPIGTFSTSDPDTGDSHTYKFVTGAGSDDNSMFRIAGNQLRTGKKFNFEENSSYSIRVRTIDQDGLYFEQQFTITITDVNEPPVITPGQVFSVPANSPVNTVVGTVQAADPDAGASFYYKFSGGNVNKAFAIDSATGQITVSRAFVIDFETLDTYTLSIQVIDQLSKSSKQTVVVNLTDVNDPPQISPKTFSVPEDAPVGTIVGNVMAIDQDIGDSLMYDISGGNIGKAFRIDQSGNIIVNRPLDYETIPIYYLSVLVTDSEGTTKKAVMTINVIDVSGFLTATDREDDGFFSTTPRLLSFTL
ncbi:hypothetical protein GC163_17330 [bacterium]|nr:hypothetical protein [bacterium]